jgi:DNA-3-methyladenine glycosylase
LDFCQRINIIYGVMPGNKLSRAFYERATLEVARDLLGKFLVHGTGEGPRVGRIVETEAYVGPDDRASHASRGKTNRTALMFGPPGYAYVYLIYGMYHCFNVVTEPDGYPAAVLIRALEPILARDQAWMRDGKNRLEKLASGPGKLCRYLQIDRQLNGVDLCGSVLYIEDRGQRIQPDDIAATKRIGIDYAGEWKEKLWRFYVRSSPSVSRR